jgi:hypothetical protein
LHPSLRCEKPSKLASGEDTIIIGRRSPNQRIATSELTILSGLTILAIPVIFIISIIVAIVQVSLKWQYYWSILLAFFFSFTMLGYVVVALTRMIDLGSLGEVFTIGFLNVFHGSYANGGTPTWIVTLTSEANVLGASGPVPPGLGAPLPVPPGLGAPLWVILMSVIGSASYTVILLVKQILPSNKLCRP